jgi:hypothetical protein
VDGVAVCPGGHVPEDECKIRCEGPDCPDGGTTQDGGMADGGLSCNVAEDCPGSPPLKCVGAHWECVNGVCEGRCGEECPVDKGNCPPDMFPGPEGRCTQICLFEASDPGCPQGTHCDFWYQAAACPALCLPDCHPLDGCMLDCEFGFATGPDGCPICECGGPHECPPVCGIYCEYGYKLDPDGCPLCECNEPPVCPPFACDIYCEHGFTTDPRGCPVCDCVEPPERCGGIAGFTCPEGYHCKISDPYPDAMGLCFPACDDPGAVCPAGTVCEHVDAVLESPKACLPACEPPPCDLLCPWGYDRNELGCEVCRCAQAPGCPRNDCALYCPWGFERDANGCEVCACAVQPGCAPLEVCSNICDNGWKIGPDGCPVCACNDRKCGYQCSMDCICEQDHFGCDLPQCLSYDDCGGFVPRPCDPGGVCVLPDMPDAMGVCVPACEPDNTTCDGGEVCIPVAHGPDGPRFGCVEPCETGCDVFCPNGYEKDWRGCDQCKCHVCPAFGCDPRCEFGVATDAMGCPTCQCLEHPAPCRAGFPQCAEGLLCDPDTNLCLAACGGKMGLECPEPRDWCKPLDPNDIDGMGVCVPTE